MIGIIGVDGTFLSSGSMAVLAVAAGIALAACAIRSMLARDRLGINRARRRILRAARLTRRQRLLLTEVATAAGLGEPASLTVSYGCFDHAAEVFLASQPREAVVDTSSNAAGCGSNAMNSNLATAASSAQAISLRVQMKGLGVRD